MADALKTEPAWKPARTPRPWWVPLVVGGISTGVGIGAAFLTAVGVSGPPARAEPRVTTSGISIPQTEAEWRSHIDGKLNELGERLAHIEGRLDRGR